MHSGTCSFSKVVISFPKRMSELQALQIMSLPIVPTYPNLLLDNIWSIQIEHDMTTRWRCTSAKISMKGKADWSLCFKIGLVLLVTKTQYPKGPFWEQPSLTLDLHACPQHPYLEFLVGALGHLEEKMWLCGLFFSFLKVCYCLVKSNPTKSHCNCIKYG